MTGEKEQCGQEQNPFEVGAVYEVEQLVFNIKELEKYPGRYWRSIAIQTLEPGEQIVYRGTAGSLEVNGDVLSEAHLFRAGKGIEERVYNKSNYLEPPPGCEGKLQQVKKT